MNAQKEALASRRKMLVALGLTPALLANIRAQASDEIARPSQRTQVEAGNNTSNLDLYSVVAGRLWRTFELSVASYRKSPDDGTRIRIGTDVFQKAEELSGGIIQGNVEENLFELDGSDKNCKRTEECAAAMGLHAAHSAAQDTASRNVIDTKIYEASFLYAKNELKPKPSNGNSYNRGLAC